MGTHHAGDATRPLRQKPSALRKAKMGAAMAKAALLGR